MLAELKTVVTGDGVYGEVFERICNDVRHDDWIERCELPYDAEARFALVEGQEGMSGIVSRAMHEINLPVSDSKASIDHARPIADMTAMRLPQTLVLAVGDAWAAFEAQIRLPGLPFSMDPRIDRLVADAVREAGTAHISGNLLRRELPLEHLFDLGFQHGITIDAPK